MTPEQLAIAFGITLAILILFILARFIRNWLGYAPQSRITIEDSRDWSHLREIRNSAPDRS